MKKMDQIQRKGGATVGRKLFAVCLALAALMATSAVALAAGPDAGYGDRIQEQLQLRDGSCTYTVPQSQLRTRDRIQDPVKLQLGDGSCIYVLPQTPLATGDQIRVLFQQWLRDGSCLSV